VIPGEDYTLRFFATTCGTGWARLAYAFVDWNNDQVYAFGAEFLGQSWVDNRLSPFRIDLPFRVPCLRNGSVPGVTRMRVFVVESGFNANPCLSFSYGGVKEFSIEVLNFESPACTSPPTPSGEYCHAGPSVVESSNLGPVQLLGVRSQINDKSDCPGETGIRDLTNLTVDVSPGGSYILDFDVTTCGKAFPRYAYAYIDFNGNKQFEARELLGTADVAAVLPPVAVRFQFTVPQFDAGAQTGITRMRVLVVEGGRLPDPCLTFAYGGVKDFTIRILPQQQLTQ